MLEGSRPLVAPLTDGNALALYIDRRQRFPAEVDGYHHRMPATAAPAAIASDRRDVLVREVLADPHQAPIARPAHRRAALGAGSVDSTSVMLLAVPASTWACASRICSRKLSGMNVASASIKRPEKASSADVENRRAGWPTPRVPIRAMPLMFTSRVVLRVWDADKSAARKFTGSYGAIYRCQKSILFNTSTSPAASSMAVSASSFAILAFGQLP